MKQKKIRNNLFLLLLVGIFLISLASAEVQTLGYGKQNTCIQLSQTCANCTFVNLTSIEYPDKTKEIIDDVMTATGTEYNYTFCETNQTGVYIYNTFGDPTGTLTTQPVDFTITYNGKETPSGIVIVFFSLGFLIVIGFLSYLFIYNMGHFGQMDYDLGDLIKNVSAYFVLLGLYLLSVLYMGNEMIDSMMVWIIGITGFTNVAMSFLFFIICFLAKRKTSIENAW